MQELKSSDLKNQLDNKILLSLYKFVYNNDVPNSVYGENYQEEISIGKNLLGQER